MMKKIFTAVLTSALIIAPLFASAKQLVRTNVNQFKAYVEPFSFNKESNGFEFVNGVSDSSWVIHVFVNEYTSSGKVADKVTFICNDVPVIIVPGKDWSTCSINPNSTASIAVAGNDLENGAEGVIQVD